MTAGTAAQATSDRDFLVAAAAANLAGWHDLHVRALGFSTEDCAVCLGPPGRSSEEFTHSMNASSVKKAREFLIARGVNVRPIQEDRQGTHFFEMRDLEGNVIEISEEP